MLYRGTQLHKSVFRIIKVGKGRINMHKIYANIVENVKKVIIPANEN